MKINKKSFRKPNIRRESNRGNNIAISRLGIARKALLKIANYKIDRYEDFDEIYISMEIIARDALRTMNDVGKRKNDT